jgi:TRAP-type C4-dicarboxylate transport system permease large subunit
MKKRNPLAVVGLSIITLGIYDLYWLFATRKELNAKTKQKVPTVWLLVSPIIILVGLAIIQIVANFISSGSRTGINIMSVLLGMAAAIGLFVIPMIWFYKFSKAVNEYTAGKMSTAVTFLVLWLLHLIGIALIQDAFNDMQDGNQPIASMQSNSGQQSTTDGQTPPTSPVAS